MAVWSIVTVTLLIGQTSEVTVRTYVEPG